MTSHLPRLSWHESYSSENRSSQARASSSNVEAIHGDARPGRVALSVGDLARAVDFYTTALGLTLLEKNEGEARLGSAGRELLCLYEQKGAQPWPGQGFAGLYHFALLLPSRLGLADALRRLAETQTSLEGASDHGVSEALYLRDPDGHGIELYRDRPRAEWPIVNGALQMVSDPLDLHGILAELEAARPDWQGIQPGVSMGHIHLHTNDLDAALGFYVDTLGFELMQRYGGSALFVAAGGYHHHLGLNVWAGVGVPPPDARLARLLWYELIVPAGIDRIIARLKSSGYTPEEKEGPTWDGKHVGQGGQVQDPAGLSVRLIQPA
jgi:catechol 2,3-dioxygenase